MKSVLKTLPLTIGLLVFAIKAVDPASLTGDESAKWLEWKSMRKKVYADSNEESFRRAIWSNNSKKIEEHNAAGRSFTTGLNEWSDLTPIEFGYLMRRKVHLRNKNRYDAIRHDVSLPPEVDWRKKGCVSPVKDQGQTSRSWAISAVGSLEGQHCVVAKELKILDPMKLVNCCQTCNSVDDGFLYMIEHNVPDNSVRVSSNEVGNQDCNFSKAVYGASMTGYVDIPFGSEAILQSAIAFTGPASVTVDASQSSFQFYRDGVYDEPSCSTTQLDHAMLVVGYGTLKGTDYWLVKNSWGVNWGMNGYIMMSRNKDNQCGIASAASYATGVSATLKKHF